MQLVCGAVVSNQDMVHKLLALLCRCHRSGNVALGEGVSPRDDDNGRSTTQVVVVHI